MPKRRKRVLVIDDDVVILNATAGILGSYGLDVEKELLSARVMLGKRSVAGFDVIITDYDMPGFNGGDVVRFIKALGLNPAPIIIGYSSEPTNEAFFKTEGVDTFIIKGTPVTGKIMRDFLLENHVIHHHKKTPGELPPSPALTSCTVNSAPSPRSASQPSPDQSFGSLGPSFSDHTHLPNTSNTPTVSSETLSPRSTYSSTSSTSPQASPPYLPLLPPPPPPPPSLSPPPASPPRTLQAPRSPHHTLRLYEVDMAFSRRASAASAPDLLYPQ